MFLKKLRTKLTSIATLTILKEYDIVSIVVKYMNKIDELLNMSLLKYGQNLTKEQINNIPFSERTSICYDVLTKYRIESKKILSIEEISIIINKLNIGKIHVIERKNIIKDAMRPFTCDELFEAFNNPKEQLSDDNIKLIQSSIDYAINDTLSQYFFVSNNDGFDYDTVKNALQTAITNIKKLKEFLEERKIEYDSERIEQWLDIAEKHNIRIK